MYFTRVCCDSTAGDF